MKCSSCGKELKSEDYETKWRKCYFCKSPICDDCTHFMAVRKEGVYKKDYLNTLSVCGKCTPKRLSDKQLLDIVDEVLGSDYQEGNKRDTM